MPITPGTHVPAYATKPADGACYLIKYLDVLGIEIPTTMKADVLFNQDRVQLVLAPIGGDEIYLARVEAIENAPRGVVCRGSRPVPDPEAFPSQGNRLLCPAGWATLPAVRPAAAAEATRS